MVLAYADTDVVMVGVARAIGSVYAEKGEEVVGLGRVGAMRYNPLSPASTETTRMLSDTIRCSCGKGGAAVLESRFLRAVLERGEKGA